MGDRSAFSTKKVHYKDIATKEMEAYRFSFQPSFASDVYRTIVEFYTPPEPPKAPRLSLVQREAIRHGGSIVLMAPISWKPVFSDEDEEHERFLDQIVPQKMFIRGKKTFVMKLDPERADYHDTTRVIETAQRIKTPDLQPSACLNNNNLTECLHLLGEIIRQLSKFHPNKAKALLLVRENLSYQLSREHFNMVALGGKAMRNICLREIRSKILRTKLDDINVQVKEMQDICNDMREKRDRSFRKEPKESARFAGPIEKLLIFLRDMKDVHGEMVAGIRHKRTGKEKGEFEMMLSRARYGLSK